MELSDRELEIIIGWGKAVDGEWGLHSEEDRLIDRLSAERLAS